MLFGGEEYDNLKIVGCNVTPNNTHIYTLKTVYAVLIVNTCKV